MATNTPILDAPLEHLRLLSESAAAHLLNVSPDTLQRMSARGEGPRRIKISQRRVGYRVQDVRAWIDARAESTT